MESVETGIKAYLERVKGTLDRLDPGALARVAGAIVECQTAGGTVFLCGNGGSSATASHVCGDYLKSLSFGLSPAERMRAVCLSDNVPALTAYSNDVSYLDAFVEPLKSFLQPRDLLIAFSGSGNSENVLRAVRYAKERGAKTVGVCGYDGGKIAGLVDISAHAPIMDMEISEDAHLIMFHAIKQALMARLEERKNQR